MYKNIIILIWWAIILIVFKVTTNFEFRNGTSLIFISLLVIFPLVLFIISRVFLKGLQKTNNKNKIPYFQRIKVDVKDKTFNKELISKLPLSNITLLNDEDKILVDDINLIIEFNKTFASIIIKNTKVIFHYYYTNKFHIITKYDTRHLQYKPTNYLYKIIVEKVNELCSSDLTYMENKKCVILLIDDKVIYSNTDKKIKPNKFKNKIKISLK